MSIAQTHHPEMQKYAEVAYFSHIDAAPVAITPHNEHLILFNQANNRHEVAYQGSADIVDILHILSRGRQEICLYDTSGAFHDQLSLVGLYEMCKKVRKDCAMKHEARFKTADRLRPIARMAIDDIYSVTLAYSPDRDLNNPLTSVQL